MVFKYESDARCVLEVLPKRLNRFGLTMHPEKTKLVRFTRPISSSRGKGRDSKGERPETFDLLGFTHYWGRSRRGYWVPMVRTACKAYRRTVRALWEWCRRYRHLPLDVQHATLTAKLRGHYLYYGIPGNSRQLWRLRKFVEEAWKFWLGRRSQKARLSWERFKKILQRFPVLRPRMRLAT